jgi:hypothetical protein
LNRLIAPEQRTQPDRHCKNQPFARFGDRNLKLSTILGELRTEKQAIEKVFVALAALNENKPN